MRKLIASLLMMASFSTACASESKLKVESPDRDTASADQKTMEAIEHPESLKYDSKEYKEHKEYLKFIDRHDKK